MKMRQAEKIVYKMRKAYMHGKYKRANLYSKMLRILCACDMPPMVDFADDAQLVHNGIGCVFHPKAKIGKNTRIYQNVTLGGNGKLINGEKTNKGGPTIEENVAVFAGACILGPITIGHDSIIGANAVITKDVPPNSLVFGNPAIIKEKTFDYNFD